MKLMSSLLVAGGIVIAGATSTVTAQSSEAQKIVSPQEVKWGPAPDVLPAGAQAAVLSGTFRLGMGETADQSKTQPLPAGSFFALIPGMTHYVFFDEDTVFQISTNGPWDLNYVNPKDDPRVKT